MVEDDALGGEGGFAQHVQGAAEPGGLVAMGVDERRQAVVGRELELGGEGGVLGGGHGVVADLTDGDDRILDEVAGQGVEDGVQRGSLASLGLRASVQW